MCLIFGMWGLGGGADEDDGEAFIFHVTDEEREEFPELKGIKTVRLRVNSAGFVFSESVEV
jgi:hypothetical protein